MDNVLHALLTVVAVGVYVLSLFSWARGIVSIVEKDWKSTIKYMGYFMIGGISLMLVPKLLGA